jgi:hypothetical protein
MENGCSPSLSLKANKRGRSAEKNVKFDGAQSCEIPEKLCLIVYCAKYCILVF